MKTSPAGKTTLPVSVIIPTFNRRTYISDAIASVRNQSYEPAELIVVDDGSTDDTTKVLATLGITALQQTHAGISAARNLGIAAATQPWIAFLDDDDIWAAQKLERQWHAIEQCAGVGLIFTDISSLRDGDRVVQSLFHSRSDYVKLDREVKTQSVVCFRRDTLISALCGFADNFMMPSTLLVRKELLVAAGLFDPQLKGLETRELLMRLLRFTDAAAIEEPLVLYRMHDEQLTRDIGLNLLSLAEIVELVCLNPQRYPRVLVQSLAPHRSYRYYLAGRYLFRAQRFVEARNALGRSVAVKRSVKSLLYYCAALLAASRAATGVMSAFRRSNRTNNDSEGPSA